MVVQILITAGPTREAIDPVRYLTNRSSGKMGYALASAAARKGHRVMLISGPTTLDVPPGVDLLPVESAAEMFDAVRNQIGRADVAVFDPEVVHDRATFTDPHQYSVGITDLLVNGVPVILDGGLTGEKPGRWLRGPVRRPMS